MFTELDQTALTSMPCLLYLDAFCYFCGAYSIKMKEAETVIMICCTHHKVLGQVICCFICWYNSTTDHIWKCSCKMDLLCSFENEDLWTVY